MNAKQQQATMPTQELHYRKSENGEYVLHFSKYTAKDGKVTGPSFAANFGDSLGVKDTQICLLNLKLRLDGHVTEQHNTQFIVLAGLNADYFAQTLQQLRKKHRDSQIPTFQTTKWYLALFGETPPFFYAMSGRPRIIGIPKSDSTRPHSISVKVLHGEGAAARTQSATAKADIEEIIASLERQAQAERVNRNHQEKRPAHAAAGLDTSFLTSIRPGRAWAALEELLREFSDPSTEFNRLYAIDRLEEPVWRDARTYAYFALQAREYTKANFSSKEKKWNFTFSKPLVAARPIHEAVWKLG